MAPLTLTGVITEAVGTPRGDGTAGSGLYAVPIGLNRRPDAIELQILEAHWNRPPSFTTMHRPGILRVHGDRLVLDGTTIDEVERYHAATLKLVVDQTNADTAALRSQREAEAMREAEHHQQHSDHVGDVAGRIVF